jgi:hypothetical protein
LGAVTISISWHPPALVTVTVTAVPAGTAEILQVLAVAVSSAIPAVVVTVPELTITEKE